ncbi:hypothetical protein HDR59_01990 [bacterium]|nr:hypothetical protein [bacterium]
MKKKYTYNLCFFILATFCLIFSIQTFGANTKNKNKKNGSKSSIPTSCLMCLNNFSPETLTFTVNEKKCPTILARCNKSTSTAKCEGIISDCFAQNCTTEGSCSDETANRALAYGCLKAESAYLPYTCASYISGLAKNQADQVQAQLDAKERAHATALKQQEAKIAADKAAAEKAAADAKVKAAQAEADAKAQQAQIEAQSKLEQQKLQAQLEEQAKQAELARQKQAEIDARNNKPNVKYNNTLSAVRKDISTAKTYTSKAFNLLGIEKINTSSKKSNSNAPIVHVYAISSSNINAKTKSYLNASKYKTEADYKCTKDTKESYIKNELSNALNILQSSRNTLSDSIAELEALNADDETTGTIPESKINTLYEVQNKLTETINTVESEIGGLKTSCETRCAGVSAFSFEIKEIKYDENGLIVNNDTPSNEYVCKEFEESSSNDIMSLFGGSSSSFGGTNQQINDLTQRVTKAVLATDRALEETEIAMASGNFTSSNTEYAVINSCIKYSLDTDQYITCITNTLGEQLSILSKYPDDTVSREDSIYQTVLKEFNNSVSVALELLRNQYPDAKCAGEGEGIGTCCGNTAEIGGTDDARICSTNLATRLKKAKEKKTKKGYTNGTISIYGSVDELYIEKNNGEDTQLLTDFVAERCGAADEITCICTSWEKTSYGTSWNPVIEDTDVCKSATCKITNNKKTISRKITSTNANTLCEKDK